MACQSHWALHGGATVSFLHRRWAYRPVVPAYKHAVLHLWPAPPARVSQHRALHQSGHWGQSHPTRVWEHLAWHKTRGPPRGPGPIGLHAGGRSWGCKCRLPQRLDLALDSPGGRNRTLDSCGRAHKNPRQKACPYTGRGRCPSHTGGGTVYCDTGPCTCGRSPPARTSKHRTLHQSLHWGQSRPARACEHLDWHKTQGPLRGRGL